MCRNLVVLGIMGLQVRFRQARSQDEGFLMKDYDIVTADSSLEDDLRQLVRFSIAEDLRGSVDWTTVCLIDAERQGGCQIVPRQAGVCAEGGWQQPSLPRS